MPTIGVADIQVVPSFKGFQKSVGKEVDGSAGQVGQQAGRTMGSRLGGALKVGAAAAGGAAIAGIGLALTKGFSRLQAIEQAKAKLTGLGHSAKGVDQIMQNALASVKGTAFGLGDAATVAANAVASGVKPGKDLERTLKLVGDAATIAGVPIEQMGAIFNKASASNKIQMDIINQLHDTGVPALSLLAKEMGVTAEVASKMASDGAIDFATFQNAMEKGMGGAALESGKTLKGAFDNTMAAVGRIGANLLTNVYPKIQEFFSGMIGWLEPLEEKAKVVGAAIGDALSGALGWFSENKALVQSFIPVIGVAVAGITAYFAVTKLMAAFTAIQTWYAATTLAQRGLNAAMKANPIGIIITAVTLLVGALVWLYNNNETARKIMQAAWKGIQNAVKFAWEKVIKPAVDAIVWFVKNVLGPTFNWLWEKVIKPVWGFISSAVQVAWGIIETIFLAIKWTIDNVLGPIFDKLYKTYIKPVWDKVSKVIKDVWDDKIKPVFQALGAFIEDKVAPGFEKGVNAIRDIWNTIMEIAKKPINFVIDTVYNKGLRVALNKVRKIVGGDPLPELPLVGGPSGNKGVAVKGGPMRAFAKGGFAAPGWALVGEEGPELVNFSQPGRVYTAAQSRKMLATDVQRRGDLPMGAAGGLWDGIKNAASSALSWVRGSLADAAGLILNPIKNGIAGTLSSMFGNTVLGDVSAGLVRSTVDNALSWIRGKDAKDAAAGLATYNGPRGLFTRPSRGPFTSMFGFRPGIGDFHTGVDIAGGGPTYAALNGVVSRIGYDPIGGHWIRLNHGGGFGTYYGHNPASGIFVKQGQKVKAGQRIGTQGMTGFATGTHLHFQTEQNGKPVNPMAYLHDNGGVLRPGLSTILNNTGKPEAILNAQQWQDMHNIARNAARNGVGGDINFNGPVGAQPQEVIGVIRTEQRRKRALAGL